MHIKKRYDEECGGILIGATDPPTFLKPLVLVLRNCTRLRRNPTVASIYSTNLYQGVIISRLASATTPSAASSSVNSPPRNIPKA
jgi:hypothetical protein